MYQFKLLTRLDEAAGKGGGTSGGSKKGQVPLQAIGNMR
jgi:hypothetical protein